MTTKQLRNKILDLAIHGRLVPQDPNDEPASALLARIRAEKEQLVKDGKLKKKDLVTTPVSDEDKPFEVPEGWEWCRLGEYVFTVTDGDHQAPPQSREGIPFLVISDVNTGRINFEKARFVPVDYYNALPENRKAQRGDLLFTVTGSYGIVIPVDVDSAFCFQRHIGLIKVLEESSWLRTILQSKYVKTYCDDVATGTAQKTVGLALLRDLLIPLPPLAEQHRIVAAVEQWMSLVDIIESGQENLQQSIALAKNKILDLAIKGKLVEKEGVWEEKTLGEVCTFESGLAYSSDKYVSQGSPLIRISNIVDGSISLTNCVHINETDYPRHFYVDKGDLLIAMSGATTGKMGIYHGENRAVLNQRVGNIKIKDHTILYAGFRNLLMESLKPIIEEIAYGGAQPNISSKMICALPIPLPPLPEQHRIVAKVEELFAQLDIIANALK